MKRTARILTAVLCAALPGMSGVAMAAVFTVASSIDMPDIAIGDGICSAGPPFGCTLRAAVQESNAIAGSDIIDVPSATFNLTRTGAGEDFADKGDLDIRDHVSIVGTGPFTVIDGQRSDRIFDIHSTGSVPLVVTIGEMTIRRGYSGAEDGGAIRNASHLTTQWLVVTGSAADFRGGGVAGVGASSFEIRNSAIEGNRAGPADCAATARGAGGGGLYIAGTASPHVVVSDTRINDNVSCWNGGGVLAVGDIRMVDVAVRGNSATSNKGRGGGLHANIIELDRVSLDSNRSWSGGGLHFTGEARIVNSTISLNAATTGGAGISSFGWLNLRHVTMANNNSSDPLNPSGALVHNGGYGGFPQPVIVFSVISGNKMYNCRILDSGGTIVSAGGNSMRNVDTDDSCGFSTVGPSGSIVLVPAGLMPLAANFGSQGRTHLLNAGSVARDSATGSLCAQKDQRFLDRPIGGGCDMGSTEQ